MKTRSMLFAAVLAGGLVVASASEVKAQFYFAPAPVVSYYAAPVVAPVVAPAPVAYYTPAVAAPVVPTVSYFTPAVPVVAPIATPVRVRRGLFGRTIVRTPFSKFKF